MGTDVPFGEIENVLELDLSDDEHHGECTKCH